MGQKGPSLVIPHHQKTAAAFGREAAGYENWARQLGCDTIGIHVTTGMRMKTSDRLLRKMKFEQVGGNYERLLEK